MIVGSRSSPKGLVEEADLYQLAGNGGGVGVEVAIVVAVALAARVEVFGKGGVGELLDFAQLLELNVPKEARGVVAEGVRGPLQVVTEEGVVEVVLEAVDELCALGQEAAQLFHCVGKVLILFHNVFVFRIVVLLILNVVLT